MELIFLIALSFVLAKLAHIYTLRKPTAFPWHFFFFCSIIGGADCNYAAVSQTGTWAFTDGGLLGDNFAALFMGILLVLFALPGWVVSFVYLHLPTRKAPGAIAGWFWAWVLTGTLVNVFIFLVATLFDLQYMPGVWGLPVWLYLPLTGALFLVLGAFFGLRWGRRHSPLIPLLGLPLLILPGLVLAAQMVQQTHHPITMGLALTQTPAGMWYSRLCLPSAIMLYPYDYFWTVSFPGICFFTAAPYVLFTIGYLSPRILDLVRSLLHMSNSNQDKELP